jgi:hypothetical protein
MTKIIVNIKDLNKKQLEVAESIFNGNAKWNIILGGRQAGKSWLLKRATLKLMLDKPNQQGIFISGFTSQFRAIFNDMLAFFPKEVIQDIKLSEDHMVIFKNGSNLRFFTAGNADAIVGNSPDALVMDEVALYPASALSKIAPLVAAKPNAKVIACSTPRGANPFYDLCMRAQSGDPFYSFNRMTWRDNDKTDLKELENAKKTFPESVFRQEYEAEFVFGRGQVFGDFSASQIIDKWWDPNESESYFFGIDWAGDGDDSSIITIVDKRGRVVYIYESESSSIPQQCREFGDIIQRYGASGYSENNGLGKGGSDLLIERFGASVTPFYMSPKTKSEIVTQLKIDLSNREIFLPVKSIFPKLDNEMSSYQVDRLPSGVLSYSHPAGKLMHDDSVDSLLMANWARHSGRSSTTIFDPSEKEITSPQSMEEYIKILNERGSNPDYIEDIYGN